MPEENEIFDWERHCRSDVGIGAYDQTRDLIRDPEPPQEGAIKSRPAKIGNYVVGALVAITFVASGISIATNPDGGKVAANNVKETCQPPSKKNIDRVRGLFSSKPPPGVSRDSKDYGLTTYDSYPKLKDLSLVDSSTVSGFSELLEQANKPMDKYGITIEVINDDEAEKENTKVPTKELLTSNSTQTDMGNIVEGTMDLPVEYVALSGVKRVVLYQGDGEDDVKASLDNQTIYYKLSDSSSRATVAHELSHGIDTGQCGSAVAIYHDPAFEELNGQDIYDQNAASGLKSLEEFDIGANNLQYLLNEALQRGDEQGYCSLTNLHSQDADKVVVANGYGFTNVAEDKATLGEVLARPDLFAGYIDSSHPILKKKFEILLARLNEELPNFVEYLAAVADRPRIDSIDNGC